VHVGSSLPPQEVRRGECPSSRRANKKRKLLATCESEAEAATCIARFRAWNSFLVDIIVSLLTIVVRSLCYNEAPGFISARVCGGSSILFFQGLHWRPFTAGTRGLSPSRCGLVWPKPAYLLTKLAKPAMHTERHRAQRPGHHDHVLVRSNCRGQPPDHHDQVPVWRRGLRSGPR
jgi:hypothetical protein